MTKEHTYKLWTRLVVLFFCFFLAPTHLSAEEEEGFFIKQIKKEAFSVQTVPITIFSNQNKLIYPGSEGRGRFVVKNTSDKLVANYELLVMRKSDLGKPSPLAVELKLNKSTWQLNELEEVASVKRVILPRETDVYEIDWKWDENYPTNQLITENTLKKSLYEYIQFKVKVEGGEASKKTLPKTGQSRDFLLLLGFVALFIRRLVMGYQRGSRRE